MMYLDYNSTAPFSKSVSDYIATQMVHDWGNASSEHSIGEKLSRDISLSRDQICKYVGCSTKSLIFTSGGTESISTVLNPLFLKSLDIRHVVSSKLEHHATIENLKKLSKNEISVHFVNNDSNGNLDLNEVKELAEKLPKALFTFLHVNNEIGTINDIKTLSQSIKGNNNNHLIHIDAVQALGKIPLNLEQMDVDFASFSAHKIGAMKGIGALYISNIKSFMPLISGGGQERGLRSGTYNYSAIKTFALAIEDLSQMNLDELLKTRADFEKALKEEIPGLKINAENSERVYNTISIQLPSGCDGKAVVMQLSRKGFFVSSGSACNSGSYEPSHVILGLGVSKEIAERTIRVSFGRGGKDYFSFVRTLKVIVTFF